MSLLCTSRRIHQEALGIFRKHTRLSIAVRKDTFLEITGHLNAESAERQHHLARRIDAKFDPQLRGFPDSYPKFSNMDFTVICTDLPHDAGMDALWDAFRYFFDAIRKAQQTFSGTVAGTLVVEQLVEADEAEINLTSPDYSEELSCAIA